MMNREERAVWLESAGENGWCGLVELQAAIEALNLGEGDVEPCVCCVECFDSIIDPIYKDRLLPALRFKQSVRFAYKPAPGGGRLCSSCGGDPSYIEEDETDWDCQCEMCQS